MNVLVVGGTGATGRHLVNRLLLRGCNVTVVARSFNMIETLFENRERLNVVVGNILEMDQHTMRELVKDVDAIGSCLGHPMTLKGTFGEPKRLVTESIQKLCQAVDGNDRNRPVRLVVMNTAGVRNQDTQEKWSIGDGILFFLTSRLVPQQKDNEEVVEYLRTAVGKNNKNIDWVIVRPDRLQNEDTVTEYKVFDSLKCSPIFGGGKTSRINVGDFMTELLVEDASWKQWRGKMPVIYNSSSVT